MPETMKADRCPNCGCPSTSRSGTVTADVPRAWQDADGTWYKGPSVEESTERCDGCGRTVSRTWQRGKLVRDEITHPGATIISAPTKNDTYRFIPKTEWRKFYVPPEGSGEEG